jgi:hypothetical protein
MSFIDLFVFSLSNRFYCVRLSFSLCLFHFISVILSLSVSLCLSVFLFASLCLSLCLALSLSLSVCLSLSLHSLSLSHGVTHTQVTIVVNVVMWLTEKRQIRKRREKKKQDQETSGAKNLFTALTITKYFFTDFPLFLRFE